MKFKLGDIVKAVDNYYRITTKDNHWYGVVTDYCGNCFYACSIYPNKECWNECMTLNYDHFEKASINEIATLYYMKEHGLNIGDRFELPDIPSHWNPLYINEDLQFVTALGVVFEAAAIDERSQKVEKIIGPEIKEMTVAEIEKELGYKVKIVKG